MNHLLKLSSIFVALTLLVIISQQPSIVYADYHQPPYELDTVQHTYENFMTEGRHEFKVNAWIDNIDDTTTLIIEGSSNRFNDGDMAVQIIDEESGRLWWVGQIKQDRDDGTFQTSVNLAGFHPGEYIVSASYGSADILKSSVTFTLGDSEDVQKVVIIPTEPVLQEFVQSIDGSTKLIFEVDVDDEQVKKSIDFEILGGNIKSTSTGDTSLVINIESDIGGYIYMEIPRSILDAGGQGEGIDDLIIYRNGNLDMNALQILNDTADERIISVDFEPGDTEIEIIGTFMVPEFSDYVLLLVGATLASSILALALMKRVKKETNSLLLLNEVKTP